MNQLVPFACSGGISTLFAYGQTGSGKTFTVSGLQKLVVEELMACVRATTSTKVSVTIVELAGNAGYGKTNDFPLPFPTRATYIPRCVTRTQAPNDS